MLENLLTKHVQTGRRPYLHSTYSVKVSRFIQEIAVGITDPEDRNNSNSYFRMNLMTLTRTYPVRRTGRNEVAHGAMKWRIEPAVERKILLLRWKPGEARPPVGRVPSGLSISTVYFYFNSRFSSNYRVTSSITSHIN